MSGEINNYMNLGQAHSANQSSPVSTTGQWYVDTTNAPTNSIYVNGVLTTSNNQPFSSDYNVEVTFVKNTANQQLSSDMRYVFTWETPGTTNCPPSTSNLEVLAADTYITDNTNTVTCSYLTYLRRTDNAPNGTSTVSYTNDSCLYSTSTRVYHDSPCGNLPSSQTLFDFHAADDCYPYTSPTTQGSLWRGFQFDTSMGFVRGVFADQDGASVKTITLQTTSGPVTYNLTPSHPDYNSNGESGPAGNVNPIFLYYSDVGQGTLELWGSNLHRAITNLLSADGYTTKDLVGNSLLQSDNGCFVRVFPAQANNPDYAGLSFLFRQNPSVPWVGVNGNSNIEFYLSQSDRDNDITFTLNSIFVTHFIKSKSHVIDDSCGGQFTRNIQTAISFNNNTVNYPSVPNSTGLSLFIPQTGLAGIQASSANFPIGSHNCSTTTVDLTANLVPDVGNIFSGNTHCSSAQYQWTGPNNFTANTQSITNNTGGTYNLTINCPECSYTQSIDTA